MATALSGKLATPMLIVSGAPAACRSSGHAGADAPRDLECPGGIGVDESHGELLAAETSGQIDLAKRGLDHLGDGLEGLVAGSVAVLVVEALEVVDVAEEQREGLLLLAGALDLLAQAFFEVAPIVESGEPVGDGIDAGPA